MLRNVKFSNFYSFSGEQEISFLANKKKTYDYYQSKSGDQITKIAGFVGGNASGKTNIMRFFSFLGYFVCRKIKDDSSAIPDIAYKTFFNNDDVSLFYVEFEHKKSIYYYSFSIKKNLVIKDSTILSEKLYIKKIQKGSKKVNIFAREGSAIKKINPLYFKHLSKDSLPKIRKDVSFIAFMKQSAYSIDVINSVYDYFSGFETNINERGRLTNHGHQCGTLGDLLNDLELKSAVEDFVCKFDVGLLGLEIKNGTDEDRHSVTARGIHSTSAKNNKLDFDYESSGTKALFNTMAKMISALKNSNVLVFDEIETGFHPEALNKLITYFIDENKDNNAQLLFSSHSLGFMNKLDMHQIFLVEKNKNGESSAFRLNEVDGIRPDENFTAKYMSGTYGAFPRIEV